MGSDDSLPAVVLTTWQDAHNNRCKHNFMIGRCVWDRSELITAGLPRCRARNLVPTEVPAREFQSVSHALVICDSSLQSWPSGRQESKVVWAWENSRRHYNDGQTWQSRRH